MVQKGAGEAHSGELTRDYVVPELPVGWVGGRGVEYMH